MDKKIALCEDCGRPANECVCDVYCAECDCHIDECTCEAANDDLRVLYVKTNPERSLVAPYGIEENLRQRLGAAFDELRREHHIIALHNWLCCSNCGVAELTDAMRVEYQGYVFYHNQGLEDLMEHNQVYLQWGSFLGNYDMSRIGHNIIQVLRKHGLVVEWNNDPKRAIFVKGLAC